MTGYGKGIAEKENVKVTVELKAVNHRFLDLAFKIPKTYNGYSEIMRPIISCGIKRGHIDVFLEVIDNRKGQYEVEVNKDLASAYISAASALSGLGAVDDLSVSTLLKLPEIVAIKQIEKDEDILLACISKATAIAVGELNIMRSAEGAQLGTKIKDMLTECKSHLAGIEKIAPTVATIYAQRLETLVKEYTSNIEVEENRLLTEVALYADKSNIDEEITRLKSHFIHLDKIIEGNKEAGRQLDFLVQECNREINTIGSKSSNMDITKLVLLLKNDIEKIREQAQNVE